MRRFHPSPRMDIPISMEIYNRLLSASCSHDWQKEDWEIAAEAIEEYLRRHDPESIPMAPTRGYQWKSLFLPDGTVLRTVFGGKNHHCVVDGDQILYNGQAVSPSGFINAVGGIRRNAWRSTWVLLPENKHWALADTLRTREQRPRKRRAARPIGQTEAASAGDTHPAVNAAPAAGAPPAPAAPVPCVATRVPDEQRAPPSANGDAAHDDARAAPPSHHAQPTTMPAPPSCTCGAERRSRGADPTPQWLCEQLQRMLDRMFALDEQHREAPACRLNQSGPS